MYIYTNITNKQRVKYTYLLQSLFVKLVIRLSLGRKKMAHSKFQIAPNYQKNIVRPE